MASHAKRRADGQATAAMNPRKVSIARTRVTLSIGTDDTLERIQRFTRTAPPPPAGGSSRAQQRPQPHRAPGRRIHLVPTTPRSGA